MLCVMVFIFSIGRRQRRFGLVTGFQTSALPISRKIGRTAIVAPIIVRAVVFLARIGKVRAELDRVGNLIIDPAHQRQRLEAALELVAIAEVPAIAAIPAGLLPGAVFDAALGFANVAPLAHVALADRTSTRLNSLPYC